MLKLLVVDDNNRDRRVAREMSIWQDLNIQVIGEAANGHLALEQIEHLGVPDIVLTDVSMPYMDGMTLSKKLQQEYPRVHVLFMSYYEEFEYARNAISVHADAYIVNRCGKKKCALRLRRLWTSFTGSATGRANRRICKSAWNRPCRCCGRILCAACCWRENSARKKFGSNWIISG